MTLKLELPEELESRLTGEANRLGLAVEQYALQLLRHAVPPTQSPTTGAQLVAYWKREGLVGSRPDIADSSAHARKLRELAQQRRLD